MQPALLALSALALLSGARALELNTPAGALTAGGPLRLTWTFDHTTDPRAFNVVLKATADLGNPIAVADDVLTAAGAAELVLPCVVA